jgi:Leucine-rich repeat (LRR) protein
MFQVKFLFVSLLAFGLKEINGIDLYCNQMTSSSSCSFDNQVLGATDTATFRLSTLLRSDLVQSIYLNYYVAKSSSFYYVPASLFSYFYRAILLAFSNGKIQEIRSNTFLSATNLLYLYLNQNNISTLGPDAFKGAQSLTHLDLSFNQLSSIDVNAFRGLSKLTYLYLQNNKLTTLNSQTFAPFSSLLYLYLRNNQISSLDKDIFRNVTNLSQLSLSYNALQTLDATIFSSNAKLLTISLNGNKINSLSTTMFQSFYNTSLTLDLGCNLCINQYFASGSLLDVAQQQALESALDTCNTSLLVKVLNCDGTASSSACSFDNQVLGINDTASFTVSSGLTPVSIQYINLNSNVANSTSFYFIPAALFTYFPNVINLSFIYGNIQEIRSNTFLNATNLQYLYLNSNNISTLGSDAFKGAQSLYSLDLSFNQLSSIDVNAFRGLSRETRGAV